MKNKKRNRATYSCPKCGSIKITRGKFIAVCENLTCKYTGRISQFRGLQGTKYDPRDRPDNEFLTGGGIQHKPIRYD